MYLDYMTDVAMVTVHDLVESPEFREFFEIARELTGILVVMADPYMRFSKRLYSLNQECPLCRLIKSSTQGMERCMKTDRRYFRLSRKYQRSYCYQCHAGLIDMVIPIVIKGTHVATINCGQIIDAPPSARRFRHFKNLAHILNIDVKRMRRAYFATPCLSREKINQAMKLFSFFANYFGEIGYRLKERRPSGSLYVDKARQFIREHFREPLTLNQVSRHAGLSPAYFSLVFHQISGRRYVDYLQEMRINEACRMLAMSDRSITDIAFEAGFNNLTHFNRTFRKQAGCSPGEYRRRTGAPQPKDILAPRRKDTKENE